MLWEDMTWYPLFCLLESDVAFARQFIRCYYVIALPCYGKEQQTHMAFTFITSLCALALPITCMACVNLQPSTLKYSATSNQMLPTHVRACYLVITAILCPNQSRLVGAMLLHGTPRVLWQHGDWSHSAWHDDCGNFVIVHQTHQIITCEEWSACCPWLCPIENFGKWLQGYICNWGSSQGKWFNNCHVQITSHISIMLIIGSYWSMH